MDGQHLDGRHPTTLPPEINPTYLSLDQLASAVTTAFSPTIVPSFIGPHWTQVIPRVANIHSILDHSILALCVMQFSRVHQHPWRLHHSPASYFKVLDALQVSIGLPGKGFTMEV